MTFSCLPSCTWVPTHSALEELLPKSIMHPQKGAISPILPSHPQAPACRLGCMHQPDSGGWVLERLAARSCILVAQCCQVKGGEAPLVEHHKCHPCMPQKIQIILVLCRPRYHLSIQEISLNMSEFKSRNSFELSDQAFSQGETKLLGRWMI